MNEGGAHRGFTRPSLAAAGFTIVETLIVLAVTGVLFAGAVVIINGRQGKTLFQTGINASQQAFQQIINETSSGYFPQSGTFSCVGSQGATPSILAGTKQQGSNDGCVFIGKIIQLAPHGDANTNRAYIVYPVAGNRRTLAGAEISSLYSTSGALPKAVVQPGVVDLSAESLFDNGLSVLHTYATTATTPATTATDFGAFGFLTTFGAYSDVGGTSCNGLCSGSQQMGLYYIPSTGINTTDKNSAVTAISANNAIAPASQVQICLASGSSKQWGLITIDSQLTVNLAIKSSAC